MWNREIWELFKKIIAEKKLINDKRKVMSHLIINENESKNKK